MQMESEEEIMLVGARKRGSTFLQWREREIRYPDCRLQGMAGCCATVQINQDGSKMYKLVQGRSRMA